MNRRIILTLSLVSVLVLGVGSAWAAEGGYYRKWYWSKSEEKKISKLEKKVKQNGKLYEVETEDWNVQTAINPRFTAEAAQFMEIFSDVFLEIFDFKTGVETKIKPTLVVFDSQAAYASIRGIPNSRGVFMHGYTSLDDDEFTCFHLYTYMNRDRMNRDPRFKDCYHPVIQHEGTHCMLQKLLGKRRLPVWLNEGMATFFEYWDYRSNAKPAGRSGKDKKARITRLQTSPTKHNLRDGIRNRGATYPTLRYLTNLKTHATWSPDGMGPTTLFHYALAESFADFLMWDKKGRKVLKLMFERLAKAKPGPESANTEVITDEEVEKLEPRWHKFLKKTWGINAKEPK